GPGGIFGKILTRQRKIFLAAGGRPFSFLQPQTHTKSIPLEKNGPARSFLQRENSNKTPPAHKTEFLKRGKTQTKKNSKIT
ncbi:hypothetical protein, partial [Lactobacillus delbrueckii]|uniref:hypothetical protein n=1 Tax=Lactobacillus delbrueckii TaxID=1584 RepID=UPI0035CEBD87